MMTSIKWIACVSAVASCANAWAQSSSPATEPPPRAAWYTYERHCADCHGKLGDGRGPSGKRFLVHATDFTAGVYKCRSTASGTAPTDDDLRRSIGEGIHGTAMPDFRALGILQIDDLALLLKSFSRKPWIAAASLEVPAEPVSDPASITRGAAVYEQMKCATCHGDRGQGAAALSTLHNDNGSPVVLTDFTKSKQLKCGDSSSRLYLTLMTGLDGTPMASYAETLTPADAWDLVHYVSSLRN